MSTSTSGQIIELTSSLSGEKTAFAAANVSLIIAPKYGYTGCLVRTVDGKEIEVTESYDQVWRALDDAYILRRLAGAG